MQLPFSIEAFFGVFRDYHQALWPAPVILNLLALVAIVLVVKPRRGSDVIVSGLLALLWTWLALAYHVAFFSRINPLAWVFAGVSLAGAWVFLWQGVVRGRLAFRWTGGARSLVGGTLVVFALAVYPLWSWLAGHGYPAMPTFGLPCPTTLYTIGMLAFLMPPHPRSVYVVPVLWCVVGAQAAFLLDVPQDLGLVAAGLAGVWLFLRSGRQRTSQIPAYHS